MWEKIKSWFNAETIEVILLFALMLGSTLLVSLGYYLDAICGFLAVIAISTISSYLDRKRINTQYSKYLKTWLEKNGYR
jgi:hypothetical protein